MEVKRKKNSKQKGVRQNIGKEKYDIKDEKHDFRNNALKLAEKVKIKIQGKKMIPHPTIKRAYIYV